MKITTNYHLPSTIMNMHGNRRNYEHVACNATWRHAFRKGQAFIELAVGMLVLGLVLSALFSFATIIIHSLDIQRTLRREAGGEAIHSIGFSDSYSSAKASDTVEIDPMATKYFFGSETVQINEEVHIPYMRLDNAE